MRVPNSTPHDFTSKISDASVDDIKKEFDGLSDEQKQKIRDAIGGEAKKEEPKAEEKKEEPKAEEKKEEPKAEEKKEEAPAEEKKEEAPAEEKKEEEKKE